MEVTGLPAMRLHDPAATTQDQLQMFGYLLSGLSETHKMPPATPVAKNTQEEESDQQGK